MKMYNELRRVEHVDHARKSAEQAVKVVFTLDQLKNMIQLTFDNRNLHRSSTMPGVIKDAEITNETMRPRSSPCRRRRRSSSMWFLLIALFLLCSAHSSLEEEEVRALSVGEELVGETMPLRHGRRVYRLAGLRPPAWYEVKISYPASIPSSFSIRLVDDPDAVGDWGSKNRRLLNTEKIIFKADTSKPVYVLVTVEAEGVVAKPNVPDRELALFNIVCDELLLGIPHFAWWVGIAALACIVLASLAPYFLPFHKLLNYEASELSDADAAKLS